MRERVVTKNRSGPVYAYIIPLKVRNVRWGWAVVMPFGASNAYGIWKMFIWPICTGKPRLGTHAICVVCNNFDALAMETLIINLVESPDASNSNGEKSTPLLP